MAQFPEDRAGDTEILPSLKMGEYQNEEVRATHFNNIALLIADAGQILSRRKRATPEDWRDYHRLLWTNLTAYWRATGLVDGDDGAGDLL